MIKYLVYFFKGSLIILASMSIPVLLTYVAINFFVPTMVCLGVVTFVGTAICLGQDMK